MTFKIKNTIKYPASNNKIIEKKARKSTNPIKRL